MQNVNDSLRLNSKLRVRGCVVSHLEQHESCLHMIFIPHQFLWREKYVSLILPQCLIKLMIRNRVRRFTVRENGPKFNALQNFTL